MYAVQTLNIVLAKKNCSNIYQISLKYLFLHFISELSKTKRVCEFCRTYMDFLYINSFASLVKIRIDLHFEEFLHKQRNFFKIQDCHQISSDLHIFIFVQSKQFVAGSNLFWTKLLWSFLFLCRFFIRMYVNVF